MKKVRSPPKHSLTNLLAVEREEPKPLKQPSILNKTHDQQHRRNANSIRKVLRELQDLKKDLNDLRRSKRAEAMPEELDNSKCRRLKAETKRSSPSPSPDPRSHSSSKNKSLSHQKEISTQTKRAVKAQSNDFSFTGHSLSPKQFQHPQSQQEDSQDYNPFSLRTQKEDHSGHKKERSGQKERRRLGEQIQSIEAAQLYQKYLGSLKNSFSLLEVSSPAFTGEDRLKLNLQLQRLSCQIRRIPIHIRQPLDHYQNVTVYARNLNNQLNHLAVLLNRCEPREKLRERPIHQNTKQLSPCKNCQENQKKDWERCHKRELRRIEKEIGRLEGELQRARQEGTVLTTQNLILMKEKDEGVARCMQLERRLGEEERKVRLLGEERVELQREAREAQGRRVKESQRAQLHEEDLNYYRTELDRIKKNGYGMQRNREQEGMVTQLKEKELLYQAIIRDKETQITDLRQKITDLFEELSQELSHQRTREGEGGLKAQLDEKGRELASSGREAEVWRLRAGKLQARNRELQSIVEQCTSEISRLHLEINALEQAADSYKEKERSLKARSKNQGRRREEGRSRKDSAFQELNDLIRNHRSNIENEAAHK